ncbi:hypothetical protein CHISP_2563 [Chitinispirillum alkaliphilum]|nr:hypothetical protein CHISP_2563 [Chitinispirillum alkaliphilum]
MEDPDEVRRRGSCNQGNAFSICKFTRAHEVECYFDLRVVSGDNKITLIYRITGTIFQKQRL